LAENVTQAAAADLLMDALARADDVVLHCHDEIVQEVDINEAPEREKSLQALMEQNPAWAAGLPLEASTWSSPRYRK